MKPVTVEAKVLLPRLPNFVLLPGMEGKLDVADISDESLRELGEAWTAALIAHAAKRRGHPTETNPSYLFTKLEGGESVLTGGYPSVLGA